MLKRWLVKRRLLVVLEAITYTSTYGRQQLGKCWCVYSREQTNVTFVVKLYSHKIFFYVFCARKYFYNEKKSKLRYALTPYTVEPLLTDTVDTHDITDNSEVPTVLPFPSTLKQPLNSGHPATPYNGQVSRSQLYANNTLQSQFSGHASTFSARLSTIAA